MTDFTTRYPDNFLVLSRINGSVVESLFSQLKFAAGGKLSSLNYSWARRAGMVKANVQCNNCNNAFYRDDHIDVNDKQCISVVNTIGCTLISVRTVGFFTL